MKSTLKMTIAFGLLFIIFLSQTNISSAESSDKDGDENTIKVYKRLIPADVLRGETFFFFSIHRT